MIPAKQLRYLACLLLWLASAAASVRADDLARGMQALELGNAEQAIELWRPLAEAGQVDAQFGLGVIYNDAMGVEQDYAEANYWFLRAAEQGFPAAQYNLGNAYKNGTGMAADPNMAVLWWRKAAEQNFPPAQFNLGSALIEGVGTPRDRTAGLDWYRRAAANGHPQAQHYLETQQDPPAEDTAPVARRSATSQPAIPRHEPISAGTALESSAPSVSVSDNPDQPAECTAWLDRDTNTHTVQLMASQAEADVRAYIVQHTLSDTAICHYRVKGKFWYSLLYGRYDSADSARTALAALPAQVRADGGYVRRIVEIRAAMNR